MRHLLAAMLFLTAAAGAQEFSVGSKNFTESVVLGEIITQIIRSEGFGATHRRGLGGTKVVWDALHTKDIDFYVDYTGTITHELFAGENVANRMNAIRKRLGKEGISVTAPIGFNNTYAIGVTKETAEEYGLETISDLREHPELVIGFSNEFMDRSDGWRALKRQYELPHQNVRGLEHDLAYRGIASGSIDVIDLYTTDAEIAYYDLVALEDDLEHFPEYDAVILYRTETAERYPELIASIEMLEGAIDEERMQTLNARAKIEKLPTGEVAAGFLAEEYGLDIEFKRVTMTDRIIRLTGEHLMLVGISMAGAIIIALPVGIAAFYSRRFGQIILGTVGIIQTIPSLALLVLVIPIAGIGTAPAILALFLYSLLPIVRNTHAGLDGISTAIHESADALGMKPSAKLWLVELPLASRSILAGIKISIVINIGTATLGALIGAGGYGQPILTGIRLDDFGLILQGAIPAALLALLAQGFFELLERIIVPRGLRI